MAEIWAAATGLAIAATGTTASIVESATAPGEPAPPNLASSSRALSDANAALLPIQRGLTAASQTGSSYTFTPPAGSDFSEMQGQGISRNADGSITVNFKGMGQGDIQTTIANANAASQLALSQKFDPQYIQSALSQEALADPQSVAAKAEENSLVQDQINRPLNDPVSEMLNSQVQDTLNAANNNTLTGVDEARLNAAVADAQGARGGSSGPANYAAPLTTGFAGEARQAGAAQGANAFLASGSSPEDIAYRREQQNLGNLSAEANGKTPESQFASLSGAQTGPTPTATAAPLPTLPGGQAAGADSAAINQWGTAIQSQNAQANPWTTGLSSLLGIGSVAGNLGFKPLAG